MFENYKISDNQNSFACHHHHHHHHHFIGLFTFTILFSHNPQIAKASLGEQCLYKTKKALQMVIN